MICLFVPYLSCDLHAHEFYVAYNLQILHMDQSPDGDCVVAAADETLRFWDVLGSPPNEWKGNNLAMGNFCGSPMIRIENVRQNFG